MNAYFLESVMTSFAYVLLACVILLLMVLCFLLFRVTIRNRGSKKSLETLETLEKAFDLAPDAEVIINSTGHIINVNKASTELFGAPESEIKGGFLDAYTIISSSQKLTQTMREEIKSRGYYQFKNEVKSHGERLQCDFTLIPLSPGKNVNYLVIIKPGEDTERREFEQNLLAARLDMVENAAGIGYWVYDYEKGTTIWSRGLYKLLAKDMNSTKPSLNFFSQFSAESQKSIQNLLIAIKNQQPYYDRLVLKGDDGILRTVDLYLKHQEGLNVDVQRSMGILREVREFSVGEGQDLYINLWTHLINVDDILVLITDQDNKLKFTNDYALSVMDKRPVELLENDITTYTDRNGKQPFLRAFESGDQHFVTEINDVLIQWQRSTDNIDSEDFTFYTGIDLNNCSRTYKSYE